MMLCRRQTLLRLGFFGDVGGGCLAIVRVALLDVVCICPTALGAAADRAVAADLRC